MDQNLTPTLYSINIIPDGERQTYVASVVVKCQNFNILLFSQCCHSQWNLGCLLWTVTWFSQGNCPIKGFTSTFDVFLARGRLVSLSFSFFVSEWVRWKGKSSVWNLRRLPENLSLPVWADSLPSLITTLNLRVALFIQLKDVATNVFYLDSGLFLPAGYIIQLYNMHTHFVHCFIKLQGREKHKTHMTVFHCTLINSNILGFLSVS